MICRSGILVVAFVCGVTILNISCNGDDPAPSTQDYLEINVRTERTFQTMAHFGASDAWSCQFVGKNWPIQKRNEIADYLFSRGMESDGSPKGIGLTLWRFNIGAGSAEQGNSSGIGDPWRRAEGFMQPGGDLDWSRHEGQRWFMQAAKARGVETFIGFVNSPPVALTKNSRAYSNGGSSSNISSQNLQEYASFLADVAVTLKDNDDIELDYISPVNEPQWDWDGASQEGSPWQNSEIASLVRLLDDELLQRGISTKIEIPEAAQIQFLYSNNGRAGRGNQLNDFFSLSSSNYIGDLESVANHVAGHSYYSTWGPDNMIRTRKELAAAMQQYSTLDYWMSEYTLLEDNSEIVGPGRDLGIDPALYMARVVLTDLVVTNASSWQWWLGVSPYDYKDGLVYIDNDKNDGQVYTSKMLWGLGNFSRFIEPGMVRVGTSRSDNRTIEQTTGGVMEVAFVEPDSGRSVVVLVNYGVSTIPVKLKKDEGTMTCTIYRTSSANDLKKIGEHEFDEPLNLAPRSITTFVEI